MFARVTAAGIAVDERVALPEVHPLVDLPATVVLVDPLSTGVLLQERLLNLKYRVIVVWSDRTQPDLQEKHLKQHPNPWVVTHRGDLDETIHQIHCISTEIHAVCCGSEYGVLLEDALALRLSLFENVRSSGLSNSFVKVDKHAQANLIRRAGLNAVRETLAQTKNDVAGFLEQFEQSKHHGFVVKPQTGAGSVGVQFCSSPETVHRAFEAILAGEHKAHCRDKYRHYAAAGVLLQEYLRGTEYIVNCVVRDSVIKTTAVFKYGEFSWCILVTSCRISKKLIRDLISPITDKRPFNGAPFVCFSKEFKAVNSPELHALVDYTENVLKAIGFQNGAVHAEIMDTADRGPVLVEINCRLHGGHGNWVLPANLCYGYDQLSVYMDSSLHSGQHMWNTVPSRPVQLLAYSQQVKMRSIVRGTMEGLVPERWERIMGLRSYVNHKFNVFPGGQLLKTIDMPSVPGEVTLVHEDAQVLQHDYTELNEILQEGIFRVR